MTRELPHGHQEAKSTADFWRSRYAEEQKRRLDIEQSTEKAVTEAAQKAKAEGIAEGRLQASKEYNIWKEGFLAGRQSVETTITAQKVKDSPTTAAELVTPLEDQDAMGGGTLASHHAVETNDSAELPVDTPTAVAELMTPEDNHKVFKEETQDSYHSIKIEDTAEIPMSSFDAAADTTNPSEGQEALSVGRNNVITPEEGLADTRDQETHGLSTTCQVGQQNRAPASGNVGRSGRYQGPDYHYTGHPSEALASDPLRNRAARDIFRALRGRGSGRASMDSSHNGRGGRQRGTQGNARGNGHSLRSYGTETRVWNGSPVTRSYGSGTRAWGNDRFTQSSHRPLFDGYVSRCTIQYILRH